MFSFAVLVLLIASLLLFRTLLISQNTDTYNMDMPPKIIYTDDILKGTVLFNEHNKTE